MEGTFYGIGVGPGDSELLTVKAVKILQKIDIVVTPESRRGKGSIALEIAGEYINKDAETIALEFPMTYKKEELEKKCIENSDVILKYLKKAKNVAFLTLGDSMLYSTYIYIVKELKKLKIKIETVPGITSFSAIGARVNIPLAEKDETLGIIPLLKDGSNLIEAIEKFDNIVIMKPSAKNKFLADILIDKGLENNFVIVTKCGSPEEEISTDIDYLRKDKLPYLSTVIIKKKGFNFIPE